MASLTIFRRPPPPNLFRPDIIRFILTTHHMNQTCIADALENAIVCCTVLSSGLKAVCTFQRRNGGGNLKLALFTAKSLMKYRWNR